jgi:cysteine desulfurase
MAARRIYLDWNATAPLHPGARAAMLEAMDCVGNPSSIHAEGRAARALIERARVDVAALVGGEAENVVFTSGATEAISAVLRAGLVGCCGRDIACAMPVLAGATEHAAVLSGRDAAQLLPVMADGRIDQEALRAALVASGPALVAIQLANNETGIIQNIRALADVVHAAGGALLCDAVQAPGRLAIDVAALGAEALVLSAHKFGGPKGIGALVFRDSRTRLANALIAGGGQERGQRGGTENLIGIAGMGAAACAAQASLQQVQRLIQLRGHFESRLNHIAPDVRVVGEGAPRLPNTCCFAIPGLTAEKALIALDLDGIALSSGSACSSGKVKASHVLKAMGEHDWVKTGALRLSIGSTTTMDDIEACLAGIAKIVSRRPKAANAA